MKVYKIYFFLDIICIIPHIFCLHLFVQYAKEDRSVRRACLPIACIILIVLTGAIFFETICMMIKYKSLTDASDKMSSLAKDTYTKKTPVAQKGSNGGFSTQEKPKYVEKANNDIMDEDTGEENLSMMSFYLFLQIVFFAYWVISYLAFNKYVQDNLPMD